jgi:rhomboid protease GluP
MADPDAPSLRYELKPHGAFLTCDADGLRFVLRRRGRRRFVPYGDLTHVAATERGLWLATRKSIALVRRTHFPRADDPEALAQALAQRLSEGPGGQQQLIRMSHITECARRPSSRRATTLIAAVCLAVAVLQLRMPLALEIGSFMPLLVREGELWRIATGNFLHGSSLIPLHLLVNMLCLLAFGLLVERPLGAVRTFLIMAAGALGAMAGSFLAGYQEVIGASGMVAALAGAALWLELNESERLPAWWRLPRRLFIGVLVLQGVADLLLPFVAAAAHLGGFLAGYLATRFVSDGALDGRPASRPVRWAAVAVALLAALSFGSAGRLLVREGAALERHARRLLVPSDIEPQRLNDLAWRIVTEFELDPTRLALAIELAEKAVARSERSDPDILDTLAEVLFTAGDRSGAIQVIDEALVLTAGERYFREQRRRFTGERAADDRPTPPPFPWSIRKQLIERFHRGFGPGVSI